MLGFGDGLFQVNDETVVCKTLRKVSAFRRRSANASSVPGAISVRVSQDANGLVIMILVYGHYFQE